MASRFKTIETDTLRQIGGRPEENCRWHVRYLRFLRRAVPKARLEVVPHARFWHEVPEETSALNLLASFLPVPFGPDARAQPEAGRRVRRHEVRGLAVPARHQTVQGEIESAIGKIFQTKVTAYGCGRTDAGYQLAPTSRISTSTRRSVSSD